MIGFQIFYLDPVRLNAKRLRQF